MARSVSRIKLGYYPLSPTEGTRLRNLLDFEPCASAVDPCAGTGAALHQMTEGAEVEKHGVELDAGRAAAASAGGIATVHGNLFDTIGKSESFSFLYLNPPYDSEIGSADNKRMEYLFLEHTFRWLVEGGVHGNRSRRCSAASYFPLAQLVEVRRVRIKDVPFLPMTKE
jgi:hypothetical protein